MFKISKLLKMLLGVAGLRAGVVDEGGSGSDAMVDAFAAHFEGSVAADDDQQGTAGAAESQEDTAARLAAEDAAAGDDGKDDQPIDDPKAGDDEPPAEPQKFTIDVDGKPVELTAAEMAEHYKAGLRQQDYTKKTMEVAETRKAAEAETVKAREQRDQYAAKLEGFSTHANYELNALAAQLTDELLQSYPVEYLTKQRTLQTRHAELQQAQQELQQINDQRSAEQKAAAVQHIEHQREQLYAKVPEWKDPAKFAAERTLVMDYLGKQGFTPEEANFSDHRAVILARKAMQFDALIARAKDTQAKVAKAPTKVARPGTVQAPEGRSTAVRRFEQTGSRDDAAKAFAEMFG